MDTERDIPSAPVEDESAGTTAAEIITTPSGTATPMRAALEAATKVGADLRGADLRGADLRGADLRDANLGGATLVGERLDGA
jgi:uncharacterized protein YjbI with pentapeptide repeats